MKLLIFAVLILIFLTACHRTQVIRLGNQSYPDTTQKETILDYQNISLIEGYEVNNDTENRETNIIIKSTVNQSVTDDLNSAEEYTVTTCCSEGRLSAQTKNERSSYSVDDVKNLLIKIYHDNCDQLGDKLLQRVYLRFKGDIQDSSYLTYFKSINYKRLQVDYLTVSNDFKACD